MKRLKQTIAIIGVFILICTPTYANEQALINEWNRQPQNVQMNVARQGTKIYLVDNLPWVSQELATTYGYTTMNVIPNTTYVTDIDMVIRKGYETCLTHEVGHVISNYNHSVYWWCNQPIFIQIWAQERYNNLLLSQGWDSAIEYFACGYQMYIDYPQMLKQTNPSTYSYIKVVLSYTK